MNNNTNKQDIIGSDLEYVTDYMNSIRSQIRNSNFLSNKQKMDFRDNDGVYGTMNDLVNGYFDATEQLLSSLDKEAVTAINVAKIYEDYGKGKGIL